MARNRRRRSSPQRGAGYTSHQDYPDYIDGDEHFDAPTWKRGATLADTKSVLESKALPTDPNEFWSFDVWVQGSGRNRYNVRLDMVEAPWGLHLSAHCSCPVMLYCKHGVAALIELGLAEPQWPTKILIDPDAAAPAPPRAPRFVGEPSSSNSNSNTRFKTGKGFSHGAMDALLDDLTDRPPLQETPHRRPPAPARISYHLTLSYEWGRPFVQLGAAKTTLKRGGEDAGTRLLKNDWPDINYNNRTDHYSEDDFELAALFSRRERANTGGVKLHPKRSRQALLELVQGGNLYWQDSFDGKINTRGKALTQTAPIVCHLTWQATTLTQDRFVLSLTTVQDNKPLVFLAMDPPLVVEPHSHAIADADGLDVLPGLERLLSAKEASQEDWALMLERLREAKLEGVDALPPLPAPPAMTQFNAKPQPTLVLKGTRARKNHYSWQTSNPLPYGEVQFTYTDPASHQSLSVAAHETKSTLKWAVGAEIFAVERDGEAEQTHLQTLVDLGFVGGSYGTKGEQFRLVPDTEVAAHARVVPDRLDDDIYRQAVLGWAEFYFDTDIQDKLRAQGWSIKQHDSFPQPMRDLTTAVPSADIVARDDQPGWFDYDVRLQIDGKAIDFGQFLPQLLDQVDPGLFLSDDDETLLDALPRIMMLPNNDLVALDWPAMLPLLRPLMAWIANSPGDSQALARSDLAALSALYDPNLPCPLSLPEGQQNLTKLLSGDDTALVPIPPTIQATLRPYQHLGLDWLHRLSASGFGGILADDMGLGKTLQCISFIAACRTQGEHRPALVVAPKSVVPNWLAEFEKFAPELKVVAHQGTHRLNDLGGLEAALEGAAILVTSYPVLTKDKQLLAGLVFSHLVLDEAQAVKNPAAKVTHAAAAIQADACFALTGTPVQNNLGELWSLANLTNPGLLRDVKSFNSAYRTPIEKRGESGPQSFLNAKLRPFLLRRDKSAIAAELPDKVITDVVVEMGDKQKAVYEAIRVSMDKKVREALAERGLARSRIQILEALLRLRQVCCDPALLSDSKAFPSKVLEGATSAKLARLEELLDEMIGLGRRVLVFSQFTSMLDRIEALLTAREWSHVRLDGQSQNRGALVKKFQESDILIFLISLKAGGVGLNLTAADTVIHFDPWWNPAVEDQATDRVYRIGQDKAVFVYRLLASGSVEEAINEMQKKKRLLAESLFDEHSDKPLDLTDSDIDLLLRPLS